MESPSSPCPPRWAAASPDDCPQLGSAVEPGFRDRVEFEPHPDRVEPTEARDLAGPDQFATQFILPRQERSSQTGNHGKPHKYTEREVDSDSLFRVFRWIPWLISVSSIIIPAVEFW